MVFEVLFIVQYYIKNVKGLRGTEFCVMRPRLIGLDTGEYGRVYFLIFLTSFNCVEMGMMDKTLRSLSTKGELKRHSSLYLSKTPRQFFDDLRTLEMGCGSGFFRLFLPVLSGVLGCRRWLVVRRWLLCRRMLGFPVAAAV